MTVSSLYGNTVPAVVDAGDPGAQVALGFKFQVSVNGWITHVRFYKSDANTGPHTVNLWQVTPSGSDWSANTLLASKDTDGTEPTGWVNVQLDTPVPITTTGFYVAGYHVQNGHYSLDSHFFGSGNVVSGELIGLASSTSGGNGVFGYDGFSQFYPQNSFNDSSYGVDVYFNDVDPSAGVTGTVAATQAPNTMAAAGTVLVSGTVAATQHPNTASAAGSVAISGSVTATQAPNVMAATGTVANGPITGTVAATQAPNTMTGHGAVAISGSVAATQADNVMHAFGHVGNALEPTPGYIAILEPRDWIAVANPLARTRANPD